MKKLNGIIVEDNRYFSVMFSAMLEQTNKLNIIAVFRSSEDFLSSIKLLGDLDVIFLDIELPGVQGSVLGKKIKMKYPNIQVVFVTGKVEFAADAFDIEATDYLIKPFDMERLCRCVERVVKKYEISSQTYVIVGRHSTVRLNVKQIIFIEKEQKNAIFHTLDGTYVSSDTIEKIESNLKKYGFIRTHKSYIINPGFVTKVEKWADRAYQISFGLVDKVALVSRSYIDIFNKAILDEIG